MIVIAIAMQKGGVGKSTLARSLSVASAKAGLLSTLIDMDPQQTTIAWSRRRASDQLPAARFSTELDLPLNIGQARDAGCDVVFIDTPPARSSEAAAAVEAADLVLIPCTPDVEAYEQLPRTLRLARGLGTRALAVLNMVAPNSTSEVADAKKVFAQAQIEMAGQVLHRLKMHREASLAGKSAQEVTVISKASSEVASLWACLAAAVGLPACAPVHPCTLGQPHTSRGRHAA